MVRFKDFILAEDGNDFDVDKFYADCEPFLEEIRGIKQIYLPKHGSKTVLGTWEIRKVIAREKPRDTPIELHNAIDDYFEARFGWRARSESIFTTGDLYGTAAIYGTVTLCFPIGENYQTLWGEGIKDLFLTYKKIKDGLKKDLFLKNVQNNKIIKMAIENTIAVLKDKRWHHNKNLKRGYESKSEVLINVDKVYLIKMYTPEYEKVINHLKSLKIIAV